MTETTPQGGETWEEFLAEDVEYTKLNEQRSELDGHIRKYEGVINDIEWRLLGKLETLQIMQTKLIELEEQEKDDQAGRLERIQGVIDENSEDRFDLYEEAGKAARHRLDMKTQWDRVNDQCGERWKVVRQLFDGA
jgi:chromosome segregation ATPase